MYAQKWINGTVIVMSLVLIVGIVAMYTFESGVTSIIPVTGSQEIPLLCSSRAHGKIQPVIQPVHIEAGESTSPGLP